MSFPTSQMITPISMYVNQHSIMRPCPFRLPFTPNLFHMFICLSFAMACSRVCVCVCVCVCDSIPDQKFTVLVDSSTIEADENVLMM